MLRASERAGAPGATDRAYGAIRPYTGRHEYWIRGVMGVDEHDVECLGWKGAQRLPRAPNTPKHAYGAIPPCTARHEYWIRGMRGMDDHDGE